MNMFAVLMLVRRQKSANVVMQPLVKQTDVYCFTTVLQLTKLAFYLVTDF